MDKKLIIAIDGYSSCGKSTFARAIADEMGYIHIDSGAMYRAVSLFCIRKGLADKTFINTEAIISNLNDIHIDFIYNHDNGEYEIYLNTEKVEKEIRGIEVSGFASRISQIHEVRSSMVEIQRHIGKSGGVVMDGRDIGTVVFPDADIKIFMTASIDIRAKRRFDELSAKGEDVSFEEVKRNIIARDIADENRDISPLRRADDAVILDNSRMTVIQQMVWIKEIIDKKSDGR